ncbi:MULTISPECIES: DUF3471 domain-containing protein [unclassified Lentimicrobium]|uniref:DUF3471 domain-containing protein n=1 Tax=unclassified Lentimicrobium TaxID=2677434 RepID=UPI0015522725|nr:MULTISPECIES: DUF3471 domain-containing protein [unclassified Lentimicrobium]NPD46647.1 DUF3471 domain-containing protein [Lentimicrobium sp. S6]NPD84772.1 DUF3471 domain-containing protein [Lentimicrobium sp. L6]
MFKRITFILLAIIFSQGILKSQTNQLTDTTVYTLGFSTYLSQIDKYASGVDVYTDNEGYSYISGNTKDRNFPATEGAYQTQLKGDGLADVFVAKYSPEGELVFATLIGGTKREHHSGITVDDAGYIYIAGGTESPDFPTTEGAYDTSFNGAKSWGGDVFVTKLNPMGTEIVFSTFIGGAAQETIGSGGIKVDSKGNVIIVGVTASHDFPLTQGVIDDNDNLHGFLSKLSPDGHKLLFSTFFGSSQREGIAGFTIDDKDNIYLVGATHTAGLPVTGNAFRKEIMIPESGYLMDHFIAKINARNHKTSYLSYFATNAYTMSSVQWTKPNRLIVCGSTTGESFPVTENAISKIGKGKLDCFVSVFNSETMSLEYASLFGGSDEDRIMSANFINKDTIVVGGLTNSADLPLTENALYSEYPTCEKAFNSSFLGLKKSFVSVIDIKNSKLLYSSYFGSSHLFRFYPDQYGNISFVGEAGKKSEAGITGFPVTKDATEPPSYAMVGRLLLNAIPKPTKEELYKDVTVADAILETYVGKYELSPGFALTIIKKENQLILQVPEQGEHLIFPRSQIDFFINGSVIEFTFNINEAEEVESMTMHPDGGDDVICKIVEE